MAAFSSSLASAFFWFSIVDNLLRFFSCSRRTSSSVLVLLALSRLSSIKMGHISVNIETTTGREREREKYRSGIVLRGH